MNILLQNNFSFLLDFDLSQVNVLFAPIYHSHNQRLFFETRFRELKKITQRITWIDELEEEDFDKAIAWDAMYEKRAFGQKLYSRQNRLFSSLPFTVTDGFTSFRDLSIKHLPNMFPEAIAPYDCEVQKELDYYFEEKKLPLSYLTTRNDLIGRDSSTRFSSFLSCGALDVRYLYNKVKAFELIHGVTKSSSWIIYELLWREFFYWHYQIHSREYFSKNGLKGELDFSSIPNLNVKFPNHLDTTIINFFMAARHELLTTGFMSNRARQIFASIWVNDLNLDWRDGARFFEENLIDYDVYSNYGNWMYLAGVGVDPRGERYFNVEKQLEIYDKERKYIKNWITNIGN